MKPASKKIVSICCKESPSRMSHELLPSNDQATSERRLLTESTNTHSEKVDADEKNLSDDDWHDRQITRKRFIRQKMKEYIDTFTVHGLTRVLSGTQYESTFWFLMLFGSMVLSLFVIQGLASKYMERHVYVQISSKMDTERKMPSLTVCDEKELMNSYFLYCGYPLGAYNASISNLLEPCPRGFKRKVNPAKITESNDHWSNGLFTVHTCSTWGNVKCTSSSYLRSVSRYNDACFTWNYNGNLGDIYGHAELIFQQHLNRSEQEERRVFVIAHDPKIIEIDLTKHISMLPKQELRITTDTTIIKRLPEPFPSKCEHNPKNDIFPGAYSRRSCIESAHYISMYKQCGETFDYVRPYIPEEIKTRYRKNSTVREILHCLIEFVQGTMSNADCPFPCEELEMSHVHNYNPMRQTEVKKHSNDTRLYKISFQYNKVDSQRVIEEMELYTLYQMACEVGGFIGLVLGASILSFIEIFTFIGLLIYEKLCLRRTF